MAVAVAMAGCNTSGCLDNQSALPKAALYSSATGSAISLNNLEISGVDAPGDSVLVEAGTAVSEVYLPMRATKQSTSWRFSYAQEGLEGMDDIVTFDYDSEPYFASAECGAMYYYRIKKYIGAYAAALGGVDIILFTGGVGENQMECRREVCKDMEYMGIELDNDINAKVRGEEAIISTPASKVKVVVIPTDEELLIASDTMDILNK